MIYHYENLKMAVRAIFQIKFSLWGIEGLTLYT